MKLEKVEYPYSTLYNKAYITTNDEGRKLVIFVENGKSVKGTPYARYLMAVKLGRFLTDAEQVDHIDNDKTNDSLDNLQILSQIENIKKYISTRPPKEFIHGTLECYVRGKCRCDLCKKAKSDYTKDYYKRHPEKREERNRKRRKNFI